VLFPVLRRTGRAGVDVDGDGRPDVTLSSLGFPGGLIGGVTPELPELFRRGLPTGRGNIKLAYSIGGGVDARLTERIFVGTDLRSNFLEGGGDCATYTGKVGFVWEETATRDGRGLFALSRTRSRGNAVVLVAHGQENLLCQPQTTDKRAFHPRAPTPVPTRPSAQHRIEETGLLQRVQREGMGPVHRLGKDGLPGLSSCGLPQLRG